MLFKPPFKSSPPPSPVPLSDDAIRAKAYELSQQRQREGKPGDAQSDWHEAVQILQQEQGKGKGRKGIGRMLSVKWWEKEVIEPFADKLDKADIFRIIERVSPVIEAVGVLLIPVVLWWFTVADQQAQEEQERAIRAQEAVKNYLGDLSAVFLDGDLEKDERLRTLTRASTLALLEDPNLSGQHKGQVIRYLSELGLIQILVGEQSETGEEAETFGISLAGANLYSVNLWRANLAGIDLTGANLWYANLYDTNLSGANLYDANLMRTNLTNVNLSSANLRRASFYKANLRDVNLADANLTNATFWGTHLEGTNLDKAFLCQTILPDDITLDPNRDCERLGIDPSNLLPYMKIDAFP